MSSGRQELPLFRDFLKKIALMALRLWTIPKEWYGAGRSFPARLIAMENPLVSFSRAGFISKKN